MDALLSRLSTSENLPALALLSIPITFFIYLLNMPSWWWGARGAADRTQMSDEILDPWVLSLTWVGFMVVYFMCGLWIQRFVCQIISSDFFQSQSFHSKLRTEFTKSRLIRTYKLLVYVTVLQRHGIPRLNMSAQCCRPKETSRDNLEKVGTKYIAQSRPPNKSKSSVRYELE